MINYNPMVIIFGLMTAPAFVGGCFVYPTSAVVAVGERVLLTCSTTEGGSIASWHMPINILEKAAIYTAPVYKQDGTIRTPENIAEGYLVTRSAENETTLQMNKTILSQAGFYVCSCDLQSTAASAVVVLDLEPKFTTNHTGVDGEPVTFSCSVSFNASSEVSCELKIKDASGCRVDGRSESTLKNGLMVCNIEHAIIANASFDQRHSCKITLSTGTKGNIIYSRTLDATVEWPPTGSTTDYFSNGGAQAEGGEVASRKIALSVLAISVILIIIITAVFFIIRSKNRQKLSSHPTDYCSPGQADRCDKNYTGSQISNDLVTSCSNGGYRPDEVIYAQVKKQPTIECK